MCWKKPSRKNHSLIEIFADRVFSREATLYMQYDLHPKHLCQHKDLWIHVRVIGNILTMRPKFALVLVRSDVPDCLDTCYNVSA